MPWRLERSTAPAGLCKRVASKSTGNQRFEIRDKQFVKSIWLEIRSNNTGDCYIHRCANREEWFHPQPLKSCRFQLQDTDKTVQSFEPPRALEILICDSFAELFAELFHQFVTRPDIFLAFAYLFHVCSNILRRRSKPSGDGGDCLITNEANLRALPRSLRGGNQRDIFLRLRKAR